MAKLPKVPKTVLPKPARKPVPPPPRYEPLKNRPSQPLPIGRPQATSIPLPPARDIPRLPSDLPTESKLQKVWEQRPKASDLKRLTPEQMQDPAHQARIKRWRQWPLFICSMAAFGMGLYGVQLYVSLTQPMKEGEVPADLSDRFDKEADGYDEKVGTAETFPTASS